MTKNRVQRGSKGVRKRSWKRCGSASTAPRQRPGSAPAAPRQPWAARSRREDVRREAGGGRHGGTEAQRNGSRRAEGALGAGGVWRAMRMAVLLFARGARTRDAGLSTLTGWLRMRLRRCAARGGGFADSLGKCERIFLFFKRRATENVAGDCGWLRGVGGSGEVASCWLPVASCQ